MTTWNRWSLAIAALAISGWACLHAWPEAAPAAIHAPSAPGIGQRVAAAKTPAAPVPEKTVRAMPDRTDWAAQFHAAASDHFGFVARAARSAYAGDGAALYYVGRALARCEETNALYEYADDADEAVAHLDYAPALRERERREFLDCRRFRAENAFGNLPQRRDGYPAGYWQSRARAAGYPVAVIASALETRGPAATLAVANALATGDPDAAFFFGRTQAETAGSSGPDAITAAAWILAACRRGADCSLHEDAQGIPPCDGGPEAGCAAKHTTLDELAADMSAPALAQAQLLSEDIQASLRDHDAAQLMKYLAL
jgi:hypothetical protein